MRRIDARRSGLTISEVLVALLLLSLLLVVVFQVMRSGNQGQAMIQSYADLANQTRVTVRKISRDVRAAVRVLELQRSGTTLDRIRLEIPTLGSEDPLDLEDVEYAYFPPRQSLERNGIPLLEPGVRGLELFAFDDLGRRIDDKDAPDRLAYLQLRFEFGDPDAPPNQIRVLDLSLTPRVPSSKIRHERALVERSLERFGEEDADASPFGQNPNNLRNR